MDSIGIMKLCLQHLLTQPLIKIPASLCKRERWWKKRTRQRFMFLWTVMYSHLKQDWQTLCCQGPGTKYFGLWSPHSLSNYSALPFQQKGAYRQCRHDFLSIKCHLQNQRTILEHSTRSINQVLQMYKSFTYIMIIYISHQEPQGVPKSRPNLSVRNIPLLVNHETNIHL